MRVISISGADGAGKSTLARKIERNLVANSPESLIVRVCPIAESLRKELAKHSDYTLDELWEKPTPSHIRHELIVWGTRQRSKMGENYFIEKCIDYAQNGLNLDVAIVDDLRFPNELNYIRDRFPYSQHIHIQCPDIEDLRDRPYYEHLPWLYCQADIIKTR